jgi:hypothetical protein
MARGSWLLVVASLLAGGCSMIRGKHAQFKPVSEPDYGRLQPNQLAPVDAARAAVSSANDEVARAKLRLEQASNDVEMARADLTAAQAATQRAQAQGDAAASSNDPNAKARAQEAAAEAELQTRSAKAHLAYGQRLVEARQAEIDTAEKEVALRQAELDKAKLTALSQARIPAASKYDPATFDARVAGAQKDYSEQRAEADRRMHAAKQAENAWRTLHAQYQARIQGQPAGTGAGPAAPPPPSPAPPPPPRAQTPPPP